MSYLAFTVLLLVTMVSGEYGVKRQHRCQVQNLRFQRHVDLERYVGRYFLQRWTPNPDFFPDLQQGRSIAKIARDNAVTTVLVARDTTGKCIKNLLVFTQVNPPGPEFTWTVASMPGVPTIPNMFLAETDYVGYLVFYTCLEEAHDGTCAKPWVVVESRNEKMTREQNDAVSRVLRRLCIDESTLVGIRQGPKCPKPENIPFRPISQPIHDFL